MSSALRSSRRETWTTRLTLNPDFRYDYFNAEVWGE
jgi:hypothetical protein